MENWRTIIRKLMGYYQITRRKVLLIRTSIKWRNNPQVTTIPIITIFLPTGMEVTTTITKVMGINHLTNPPTSHPIKPHTIKTTPSSTHWVLWWANPTINHKCTSNPTILLLTTNLFSSHPHNSNNNKVVDCSIILFSTKYRILITGTSMGGDCLGMFVCQCDWWMLVYFFRFYNILTNTKCNMYLYFSNQ